MIWALTGGLCFCICGWTLVLFMIRLHAARLALHAARLQRLERAYRVLWEHHTGLKHAPHGKWYVFGSPDDRR